MGAKEWHRFGETLKELLELEFSPVALRRQEEPLIEPGDKKVRVCRAILSAGKGETVQISKENNACFGAAWHMGFRKMDDTKVMGMIEKFVVEGEKLFASYDALDTLVSQMGDVPDNSRMYFLLSPLEKAEFEPELVIVICNAEAACRLLTLATFSDGIMPKIKIGGPTCRMAITYPLLTGELNISFYDYTARTLCNVEKDKLLISIPYGRMPQIVESIDICSAGRAKIEFPPEFRKLLQKRLAPGGGKQ